MGFHAGEELAFGDFIAGLDAEVGDGAGKGSDEGLLHLHGFEDEDFVTGFDVISVGGVDGDDLAGEGADEAAVGGVFFSGAVGADALDFGGAAANGEVDGVSDTDGDGADGTGGGLDHETVAAFADRGGRVVGEFDFFTVEASFHEILPIGKRRRPG